jgi:hypothetical protein
VNGFSGDDVADSGKAMMVGIQNVAVMQAESTRQRQVRSCPVDGCVVVGTINFESWVNFEPDWMLCHSRRVLQFLQLRQVWPFHASPFLCFAQFQVRSHPPPIPNHMTPSRTPTP